MRKILVVNSSVSGDASASRLLVEDAVQCLLENLPDATVTYRDVSHGSIPHLTPETFSGVRAVAGTDLKLATRSLSDELLEELRAADVIVIGAPIHNFSIPSPLRAWFDHVLRPCVAFAYSDAGPQGLLTGKSAIVVETRGSVYSEGQSKVFDFQEPYLRQLLGLLGLTDLSFIHAERLGSGPEVREQALSSARSRISEAARRIASAWPERAAPSRAPLLAIGYDGIMQTNLLNVFGEREPVLRLEAIRTVYAEDAVFHEPGGSARGHDAIFEAVSDLLARLRPASAFSAMRPAIGHNGVGRLQWRSGPPGEPAAVTGLDVAHIKGDLIRSMHVFIDQPDPTAASAAREAQTLRKLPR